MAPSGDSGAVTLDREGWIVAMLTDGARLADETDVTFGTAWYDLERSLSLFHLYSLSITSSVLSCLFFAFFNALVDLFTFVVALDCSLGWSFSAYTELTLSLYVMQIDLSPFGQLWFRTSAGSGWLLRTIKLKLKAGACYVVFYYEAVWCQCHLRLFGWRSRLGIEGRGARTSY